MRRWRLERGACEERTFSRSGKDYPHGTPCPNPATFWRNTHWLCESHQALRLKWQRPGAARSVAYAVLFLPRKPPAPRPPRSAPERGQCEETYRSARVTANGPVACGDRCPNSGPRAEDGSFLCARHARLRREWSQPGAACSLDRSRFVPKRHGKRLPVDVRDAYLAEMRAVCLRYNISPDPATWSLDVRRKLRRRHATPTDLARKHGVSIPRAHELLREMALMPLVCQHPLVTPRRGRPHCAYRVVGIAADDPAAPRLVCSYHQRQYAQVTPLRQVVVSLPQQGRELLHEVAA